MGKYFCVRRKNRRKHSQLFKQLFSRINSHFGTSNQISANRKLNILLINSIYLLLSFFRYVEKTHADQSICKIFYGASKERTHKPSKVAAAKNFFSSVYVIDTTCFVKYFLFHVRITSRCFS